MVDPSNLPGYSDIGTGKIDLDEAASNNVNTYNGPGALVSVFKDSESDPFYASGGARDPKLTCSFQYTPPNSGVPKVITLPLSPNGVNWTYNLRSQIYNTLGGQVIQILGVDISDVTITGQFGFESWFGKKKVLYGPDKVPVMESLFRDMSVGSAVQYNWDETNQGKTVWNGMMQMAHWFRDYFTAVTQPEFEQQAMNFKYPHRNWNWPIRPRSFPTIQFSQGQDYAPTWTVVADYIEYLQDRNLGTATMSNVVFTTVKDQLSKLSPGVGIFTEFLQWSENVFKNQAAQSTFFSNAGGSFAQYTANFNQNEIQSLISNSMSYMQYDQSFLVTSNLKGVSGLGVTLGPKA